MEQYLNELREKYKNYKIIFNQKSKNENIKLSILICSVYDRINFLHRILGILSHQIKDKDNVEIIVNIDDRKLIIGEKRNQLLSSTNSQYVAFQDDDDAVVADYVNKVLSALQSNPDVCSLEGIITTDGKNPKKFIHSLKYKHWFQANGIYYRNPNHLNATRRSIAIKVGFNSGMQSGEDHDYSKRLLPYLKKESYISGPIYMYLYVSKK